MLAEAEALLRAASRVGPSGRYQIEGAIQSAHIVPRRTGRCRLGRYRALYDLLLAIAPSPVVAVNRAVALAQHSRADAGLAALDSVAADDRLGTYQPFWAARAELLAYIGNSRDAALAYDRAVRWESDAAVRAFQQAR